MLLLTAFATLVLAQADAGAWPLPVPQPAPVLGGRPNDQTIAWLTVVRSANVKPGELVLVTGGIKDHALLEALALYVTRAGAQPVLQIESEALHVRSLTEVPAAADVQVVAGAAKLWRAVDTVLTIPFAEHLDYLHPVPAARRASWAQAAGQLETIANQRGVKRVELGNGLYPTDENAQRLGVTRAELSQAFFSAVAVDPKSLAPVGAKLAAALKAGKVARLTHPNGTDVTVKLAGRAPRVATGTISDDDVKAKGPGTLVWLPAGEVYVTPAPGTAEGQVNLDRAFYAGTEVTGLKLTFKAGRLTSMTARKGLETLQALYDSEKDPRKSDFAFLDVGLNPQLDAKKLATFNAAGMVSVGFGNNLWAGGDNDVAFDVGGCYLAGATLTIDGKPVVKDGKLF